MKKGKKPTAKPKEFSPRPFALLKGVRTEAGGGGPVASSPSEEKPEQSVSDVELFLRAVADVRSIHTAKPAEGTGKAVPSPAKIIEEEERRVFIQALESLHLDVRFEDALPEDVEPLRPLPVNRLRQLKRGALRIDLELDLHGLTRDEAIDNLARFITGAYQRNQRAVLVITGKGNNSPEEPVLQGAVASWLRDKGKGMVAEFAPAPRSMGGSGAFVVFLKEKTGDSGLGPKQRA